MRVAHPELHFDEIGLQLDKLLDIVRGSDELSLLGRILSINQGIKARDFDEYKYVSGIETSINRIYVNYLKQFEANGRYDSTKVSDFIKFDFEKFITDEEYQKQQIDQFDKCKTTFNVLQVIADSPHFSEMLSSVVTGRRLISNSTSIKIARKLAKDVFKIISPNAELVDDFDTRQLSQKEFRALSKYIDDVVVLSFISNLDNSITLNLADIKQKVYDSNFTESNSFASMAINTPNGISSFKRLMDTYIIPELKRDKDFKNNDFIRMLTRDSVQDSKYERAVSYYKLGVSANADEDSDAYKLWDKAREGLQSIYTKPITVNGKTLINNLSIGDAFFLYNLLVSKEGFSSTGFSNIFEDMLKAKKSLNLATAFANFVADVDSSKINIDDQFKTEDALWNIVNSSNA